MRAHENPFRISLAEGLRFRGVVALDQVVARLAALGYRGAIVGPEGSGKTTLLRELEAELAAAGLRTKLVRFDDLALLHPLNQETILMIDGAEKLPWLVHAVLALTTARLVVTAHGRREGLPVLLECAASPALMEELLIELAGPDPALVARAKVLFQEKRGNVREVFGALYDALAEGGLSSAGRPFPFTTKSAPSGN
jgi:ABC-type hemin transport system ATPase subunit